MSDHTLTDSVLILEPLTADDASDWLAGEDEEQLRWFEAPRPAQLHDVQRFITSCQESWREMGNHRHWGIRRIDSDVLLGGVDLRALDKFEVNLSYVVFPQFRRQRVAQRASRLALNYATSSMGAKAAIIKVLPGNVNSRNLALGLGSHFVREEPSDGGQTFQVFRVSLPLIRTEKAP
jgi:RimJ/RimL family protein N-acetyltransferase